MIKIRWDLEESAFDNVNAVDLFEIALLKSSSTSLIEAMEVKIGFDILI